MAASTRAKQKTKKSGQRKSTVAKLAHFLFPYGLLQLLGFFLIVGSSYSMANGLEILSGNPIFTTVIHSIAQTETSAISTQATQAATSTSALSCSTHPCTLTVMISETIALNPYLAGKVSVVQIQNYNFAADVIVMLFGLFLLFLPMYNLPKLISTVNRTGKINLRQLMLLVLSAFLGAEFDKLLPLQVWWTHLMMVGVIMVVVIVVLVVVS